MCCLLGFRPLDGDDPADPFIAREWRNILPFCSRRRVRNESFSQIRWYSVYRTRETALLVMDFSLYPAGMVLVRIVGKQEVIRIGTCRQSCQLAINLDIAH